jgi:small subunit ribosomal protein S9
MEEQPKRLPKQVNNMIHAIGRRKESTARVYLSEGDGAILVNGRAANDYFSSHINTAEYLEKTVKQPFHITKTVGRFNVNARIDGGGCTGQLDALKLGIARALTVVSAEYRPALKKAGLLTRDARVVERKKYGRRKARKSEQYSKR